MKLLIATENPGKFKEISVSLANLPLTLSSLKELNLTIPDSVEDGKTYAENAFKKAQYAAQKTGLMTLADDSGIAVDALKNELGVKTRRWGAGANVSDQEWINYFLKRMESCPDEKRTATFVCNLCLVDKKGNLIKNFIGKTKGKITRALEAPIHPGLPLSSCFIPEGFDKVYITLNTEKKNQLSHRGKALQQVKDYFQILLNKR
ncbi:MAG: non-canonical purine NTP pyrophosphatase [Nanoarchaeota archaeon]